MTREELEKVLAESERVLSVIRPDMVRLEESGDTALLSLVRATYDLGVRTLLMVIEEAIGFKVMLEMDRIVRDNRMLPLPSALYSAIMNIEFL